MVICGGLFGRHLMIIKKRPSQCWLGRFFASTLPTIATLKVLRGYLILLLRMVILVSGA